MKNGTQSSSPSEHIKTTWNPQLIVCVAVSAGCTAAAVATGTYAFWLSRRRLAGEALISVHDLLETCRERVTQMETELSSMRQ